MSPFQTRNGMPVRYAQARNIVFHEPAGWVGCYLREKSTSVEASK